MLRRPPQDPGSADGQPLLTGIALLICALSAGISLIAGAGAAAGGWLWAIGHMSPTASAVTAVAAGLPVAMLTFLKVADRLHRLVK